MFTKFQEGDRVTLVRSDRMDPVQVGDLGTVAETSTCPYVDWDRTVRPGSHLAHRYAVTSDQISLIRRNPRRPLTVEDVEFVLDQAEKADHHYVQIGEHEVYVREDGRWVINGDSVLTRSECLDALCELTGLTFEKPRTVEFVEDSKPGREAVHQVVRDFIDDPQLASAIMRASLRERVEEKFRSKGLPVSAIESLSGDFVYDSVEAVQLIDQAAELMVRNMATKVGLRDIDIALGVEIGNIVTRIQFYYDGDKQSLCLRTINGLCKTYGMAWKDAWALIG